MTKNVEFSGYYFYMKMTIKEDFQICISVTLMCGMSIEQKNVTSRQLKWKIISKRHSKKSHVVFFLFLLQFF